MEVKNVLLVKTRESKIKTYRKFYSKMELVNVNWATLITPKINVRSVTKNVLDVIIQTLVLCVRELTLNQKPVNV